MPVENDTRGWIMTCISGIACVLGATIICVDIVVRLFPRWRNFSIAESDAFLSASLSLSFGVMLFSALYSMLPQSKKYLKDAGYSPRDASYLLIGLFLTGVIGIRLLSGVIHGFLPTHVVDCDHTHDDEEALTKQHEEMAEHSQEGDTTNGLPISKSFSAPSAEDHEETPLLARTASQSPKKGHLGTHGDQERGRKQLFHTAPSSRKHSVIPATLTRTFSKYVAGQKENCDEEGPCMGFSDPCGQDCFKVVHRRGSVLPGHGPFARHQTWRSYTSDGGHLAPPLEGLGESPPEDTTESTRPNNLSLTRSVKRPRSVTHHTHHFHHPEHDHAEASGSLRRGSVFSNAPEHHHHVPTNAFMSIGLQTSLAIALHKAPEGFITYATNHANPQLGFSVFMALFIHNITEGFAMSLPLYLALDSRFKAIAWSSFFGGVSQPIGAGVAALWFKLANRSSLGAPTEGIYGGMFAVTSGVMTSVALSLFAESLQLTHNKGTCIAFAFLGMGILGFSFALTAS
ncbi:Zinc transporter [Exophiala dermatitidis]|uniref:ZIP family zinc transporter n=2 Tax=Exophiala dermatitidis TaxID=5970 RepID=H6CAM3_EXODN|nr:ZIP family zinc transporter [Exophiala dermatitidis NIH/UT8656]KAJ4502821.1 Zinc transporter [Exophiala dermatitidis]EHY60187.1 ZIP family zinc transporter [Exophiala dermatitidis NIH/UT8656]KAJ4504374.1 Zinc transporter [Exophiala dermatitidis]KAJ4504856.1 Zinc transporter [Exophiala dermatitidis]KAJ4530747.1 Zinc transporter [Exophiala dermatitidis]